MKIKIFQIKVNEGRRKVSPEAVHELADSISKVGLLNPITVDKNYNLIAGLHRLEAAKLLGWAEITCTVSGLEGLMAELAEIDENFVRKGLSDIERGDLLLRRKEIYETLHPETKNGGDRKSEKIRASKCRSDFVVSFAQDATDKLDISKRTVERQIQTAKNLTPEAKGIIRTADVKVTKANALKLSRLAPEHQKEAAIQLAAGAIRSVDEYHSALADPKPAGKQVPELPEPPPEDPAPSAPGTGRCLTIRDFAADLKNPDKDRSLTPSSFLVTFSLFLRRFCRSVKSYAVNEYAPLFPALTPEQLDQIQEEISFAHTALDDLFNIIERKGRF